jgi:hypothetical protein
MTKRYDYIGGFISATSTGQQGGIYSLARQFQLEQTNSWNTDSNFANVSLVLNADSTVTPFITDSSANNFLLSVAGDVRPNNISLYNRNFYSNYFNGSSDFLSLSGTALFSITTATTPFTIEAWIMPMSNTGCIFSESYTGAGNPINICISMADGINMDAGGGTVGQTICFGWYNGSAWITAAGANQALTLGRWTHVACVFTGSTTKIYYNGYDVTKPNTPVPATTWGVTGNNGDGWTIARRWDGTASAYFNGFIKDFRFVRGTAVYTSDFTPPAAPLTAVTNTSLLTCQNNTFIDNSGNSLAITRNGSPQVSQITPITNTSSSFPGAVYFDGTVDYLSVPDNAALDMESSNFTIQCWFYPTTTPNNSIFSKRANTATYGGIQVGFSSSLVPGLLVTVDGSTWGINLTSSISCVLNAWNHIALVRNGTSWTLYVNGVSGISATLSGTVPNNSAAFTIGSNSADGSAVITSSYISDFSVVKGTAVYTGNFTPPTEPLTAVAGTSLLTLQNTGQVNNSSFIDRGPYNLIVTRNGNITAGSFNPYASGWSSLFTGGSDNISVATNAAFGMGTSNYTIECWIYATANPANGVGTIVDLRTGATASATAIRINASLQIMHYNGPANVETAFTTRTISLNTWTHIAVVRISGTVYGYINGLLAGSVASNSDFGSSQPVLIGQNRTAGYGFNGYISNFHIVKSVALYTADFTLRLSSITATSNTSLLTFQNNRYVDNSSSGFTITSATAASLQKFSPFTNTNQSYNTSVHSGSFYLDGASDYLSIAATPSTVFLTNNFTIEFWVYFTNAAATGAHQGLYSNYTAWTTNSIYFGKHPSNSGFVAFYVNNYSTSAALLAESSLPPNNAWTHYALVRNGTSVVLYRNGAVSASNTVSATLSFTSGSNPVFIGAIGDILSTSSLSGYMADFRISNYPVYTAAFTPPAAALSPNSGTLLMIGSQTAIVDSTMNSNFETNGDTKISTVIKRNGSASIALDGNTDWLFTPGNRIFNFGSSNWTVEAWVYLNAMPTSDAWPTNFSLHMVLTCVGTFNGGDGFNCMIGQTKLLIHSNDVQYAGTAHGMVINTWYHIAYVRNGNTIFFYVNGNSTGSAAFTGSVGVGANTWIGCETGQGAYFNGYIDDLRVTRNTVRYTGAFSPPGRLAIR